MNETGVFLAMIAAFLLLFLLAIGVRHSTFRDAVENCIQANSDWTVATANAYCNSVIREGKRP